MKQSIHYHFRSTCVILTLMDVLSSLLKTLALRLFYFRFLSFKGHSKSDACLGLKQETCMKLLNTLEKIQTNATNVTMHRLMQVL